MRYTRQSRDVFLFFSLRVRKLEQSEILREEEEILHLCSFSFSSRNTLWLINPVSPSQKEKREKAIEHSNELLNDKENARFIRHTHGAVVIARAHHATATRGVVPDALRRRACASTTRRRRRRKSDLFEA
jgi:hypothetical protein